MRIGFAYNLKDSKFKDSDTHAEYETKETVDAVSAVLSELGQVVYLPCDGTFIKKILKEKPDVVFNIAEGWGNRDRESFVPAVLRMLGIPFTGSDATALGITMDKALTKRILRDAGIKTADFLLYDKIPSEPPFFGFPAFVKPNCDGSSRGIYKHSVVFNMEELVKTVRIILGDYYQPAIAEPYLEGRDFSIGLLGNNPPYVLKPCEVLLGHEQEIKFFSYEYKKNDTDKLDFSPKIENIFLKEMRESSIKAWEILGISDYARLDFRTDKNGIPHFLEINALPGISPVSGIFIRQATESGFSYESIILKILERTLFSLNKDVKKIRNS